MYIAVNFNLSKMNIGANIRKIRKEKDKNQEEIYDAIGVNQSTYSKIENDKYKIDIETLKNIADALEVGISKLIGEDKVEINHTNKDTATGDSGIIIKTSHSEKLIESLESQIALLKEQNTFYKEELKNKNEEILNLKGLK